jgi:glycosyltransferase involved in cell wall biosynthesis
MIGIVSGGRQIGGAESLCLYLAEWLHERGEDVWLWVGTGGEDQLAQLVGDCPVRPIGVYDLEWSCARSSGIYLYGSKLIGQQPGLAKRVNSCPRVFAAMGGFNPDHGDARSLNVSKFIIESQNQAQYARRYLKIPWEKIFVCRGPIVVPEDVWSTRLFPDKFTFGFVGRFAESKQVIQVLQAFKLMDDPDCALTIIGDGWAGHRKMLQHFADGMENVKFAGLVMDRLEVLRLIAGLDCFVSASQHEGVPTVMREAMLLKTPVVATDGIYFASDGSRWPGGTSELVKHERTGLLNPLNDIGGLIDCMRRMKREKELRERLAETAHEAVLESNEADGQRLWALLRGEEE